MLRCSVNSFFVINCSFWEWGLFVSIEHCFLCCRGKLGGDECLSYSEELCRSPSEKVCLAFPLFFLLTCLDPVVLSLPSAEQSSRTTHRHKHRWIQVKKRMIKTRMFHTWLDIQLLTWRTVPFASTVFVWTRSAAHLWVLLAVSSRFCHTDRSLRAWGDSSCSSGPQPGLF